MKICRDVVEGVLAEVDVEGLVVDLPMVLAEIAYALTVIIVNLISEAFLVLIRNVPGAVHL